MRLFLKPLILALVMAFPWLAEGQIAAPQINLTGNLGCQGFPCLNSGTLTMTDASRAMTAQETSATGGFVVTGTWTANRTLTMPAGRFQFVSVGNLTTGGFSLMLCSASGGTCLTIPNGQVATGVWFNGTNVTGALATTFNAASPPPIGNTTPNTGAFTTVTAGSYAGNGATQTVVNLTQGTAAATPPANTIQFGAPTTVPSSYGCFLPSVAPTDSLDVWACPSGGGTGTWMAYGCGSANIPCTNTSNAFTSFQSITNAVSATPALTLTQSAGNTESLLLVGNINGTSFDFQTPGEDQLAIYTGNSVFAPNTLSFYDNTQTSPNLIAGMASGGSGTGYFVLPQFGRLGFIASGDETEAPDTALSRDSAGVLDVGTGAQGSKAGTLNAAVLNVGTSLSLASSQAATAFQGTTGTHLFTCAGSFTSLDLVSVDANGNCVDSGILRGAVVLTNANNVYSGTQQYIGTVSYDTGQPATSSANISSPSVELISHYWTGTATAADSCVWSAIPATGNNPLIAVQFTCSGSSGGNVLSITIPTAVPSLSATGKVTASNVFAATTPLTFTGTASGVTVSCTSGFTCTSKGGTLSVVSTTFTTGTVTTLTWPATPSAPTCIVSGTGSAFAGFGTGVPTTTGFALSNNVSIIGTTQFVEYLCQPNL